MTITTKRLVSAYSANWGTQTIALDMEGVKLIETVSIDVRAAGLVFDVKMKNPATILGPSIYVRLDDLAEGLGIPTTMRVKIDGKDVDVSRLPGAIYQDVRSACPDMFGGGR